MDHVTIRVPNKMDRLNRLLSETQTNGELYTHVLLGGMRGKVNIGATKAAEFWDLYCECVRNKSPSLYLAEKPLNELPIVVDIDLETRYVPERKSNMRLYDMNHVRKIVGAYQSIVRNDILCNLKPGSLTCVLLEKEPRLTEINGISYIKNGFHLHFPKCFVDVAVQKAYVIPMVTKRLEGMFDHLYTLDDGTCGSDDDTSDEDNRKCCKTAAGSSNKDHYKFVDAASITVHWLMYGSRKHEGSPYIATKCFDDKCNEMGFEEAFGDYILPRLKGQDVADTCSGRVMSMLPRILSTRLHGRTCYYFTSRPSVDTPAASDDLTKIKLKRPVFVQKTINETLKEIGDLLPLIDRKRADDRSDWLSIGFCLHNITEGDDEGLSLWLEFSERSDKYNEAECICIWNSMVENSYTIKTIQYFAKVDSPEEYNILCKKKSDDLLNRTVEGGHNDLAKMMFNEYSNEFVYSTYNSQWYMFKDHVWSVFKSCYDLRERISNNNGAIICQINDHIVESQKKLKRMGVDPSAKKRRGNRDDEENEEDEEDEKEIERLRNKISALTKLIKQCKNAAFKNCVMKECEEVFRNDYFSRKLNDNPYLVAFKNGVYDFKNDCFRDGKPEDYLSVRLPIEYKDYRSLDNPEVLEVAEFFRKILPDDDVRQYFLEQACQLFIGGNHDKVFCVWTGSGDNGKSVTQSLFEKMLGELAVKISTKLITGEKSKMGQAMPELARTGNGVRWVVMDEPSQNEQITTGLLKAITGNDSYYARDLYEGGKGMREIVPMYKLHMLCNTLPAIRNPDEACWERVRVIPFESKFVDEDKCPPTYEEQLKQKIFLKDPHLKDRIGHLLQPFAWYLIYHLRILNKKTRKIPDKVRIATNMYREENNSDPIREFVDDNLDKNDNCEISVDDIVSKYREWWRVNYPGEKLTILKKAIVNSFGKVLGDVEEIATRGGIKRKVFRGYAWQGGETNNNNNPMLM